MTLSSMWNSLCTIIAKVTGFVTSSLTRSLGDRIRSYPTLSVVSAFQCVSVMWLRRALTWGALNSCSVVTSSADMGGYEQLQKILTKYMARRQRMIGSEQVPQQVAACCDRAVTVL